MTIEKVPIKNLNLLDKNPRRINDEAFKKLCKSLSDDPDFLRCRPILVNRCQEGLIVYAGNQRVRAAKKLGWKTIACEIEENVSDELMKTRIIKDNQHYGTFDFDILANEFDIEMLIDCGFTEEQLSILDIGSPIDDAEEDESSEELLPAEDKDAITKLGDIYELGEHRLICGDSTDPDTVQKVMNGLEPVIMVTDPPYGVEYDPSWRSKAGKGCRAVGKVQNDDRINWALAWSLFPGNIAYIWHAGKFCSEVQKSLEQAEFEIISQIIWSKQNFALSRGDYHWKHEPCWYAVRSGKNHNWKGDRKQHTIWEIASLNAFGKSKEEDERTAHSTQKPLECMSRPIINHTDEGDYVYDPFLGSGTTMIASEKLNRKCIGIELSPGYCDIIVRRWVRFMKKNDKQFYVIKNGVNCKDEF